MKKNIFTGIGPTSKPHIGNYLGMISPIKELLSDNTQLIVFIPDLHGLSSMRILTEKEKEKRRQENKNDVLVLLKFLYSFFEDKAIYYLQSDFYQFTYATWIFSSFVSYGALNRMTQFKSMPDKENIKTAVFFYPILMAADILMMDTDIVPAGEDQKQHIEFAKNIAIQINKIEKIFKIPEIHMSKTKKIFDLQNPNKKMSKSELNKNGAIFFQDTPEEITKKIKKAVTDSFPMPTNILEIKKTRPGIYNLCQIYSSITNQSFSEIENEFGDRNISDFKIKLIEILIIFISACQQKINKISDKKISEILEKDKNKIFVNLEDKLKKLKNIVGL